jgi:Flp pilus assembly protein TadB
VVCAALLAALLAERLLRPVDGRSVPQRGRRRRSRVDVPDQLIGYLDVASRELRSGASLAAARRRAAESHPLGASVDRATLDPDGAVVAQAMAATTLGGSAAAALDHAAAVLRERRAVRHERIAQASMARLSARVLTVVPLGFAAWAAASSASTRRAYLDSPLGAGAALLGVTLNLCGWWWMRRIVGRHG